MGDKLTVILFLCDFHDIWLTRVSYVIGFLSVQHASDHEPLLYPGRAVSEGQFYSPPESMAGNDLNPETHLLYCVLQVMFMNVISS